MLSPLFEENSAACLSNEGMRMSLLNDEKGAKCNF